MTCHRQGQFQGPSSTLQSFVRGRSGVALEQHITFCRTRGFPVVRVLCWCVGMAIATLVRVNSKSQSLLLFTNWYLYKFISCPRAQACSMIS